MATAMTLLAATVPALAAGQPGPPLPAVRPPRRPRQCSRQSGRRSHPLADRPDIVGQPRRPVVRAHRGRGEPHRADRRPARRADPVQPHQRPEPTVAGHQCRRARQWRDRPLRRPGHPHRDRPRGGDLCHRSAPGERGPAHDRPAEHGGLPGRVSHAHPRVHARCAASAAACTRSRWRCTARAPTPLDRFTTFLTYQEPNVPASGKEPLRVGLIVPVLGPAVPDARGPVRWRARPARERDGRPRRPPWRRRLRRRQPGDGDRPAGRRQEGPSVRPAAAHPDHRTGRRRSSS